MISFTLPLPPSANRYWRHANNRAYLSTEAKLYKRAVYYLLKSKRITPLQNEVAIKLNVYRQRKAGDLDNRIKVCLDALNGLAYKDDSQIVEIHAHRHDDKLNPRIEVELSSV